MVRRTKMIIEMVAQNKSVIELSLDTGIPRTVLSEIRNGSRNPNDEQIALICKALNCPAERLGL